MRNAPYHPERLPMQRGRYRRYAALYTILFIVALCCVYFCFWRSGKSFLWGSESAGDGVRQHYTAFVYFGRWGRELLYNLFVAHQLTIPTWDFSIGYGSDIMTTLHYYVLGDPLNLVSLLTPVSAAEYVFSALVPVRLYLAGLFFSCFCFRFEKGQAATLCGAISYVFCGYALYAGVRHPFFLNPMIYFPLLLLGAERVLHREKPGLYIFAVFLSAVSNFYFFYQLVFFTVLYAVFRYFMLYRTQRVKQMALSTLRLGGYALIGVAMAAVILLPVLAAFFGDNRLASDYPLQLLYDYSYYEGLLRAYLTNSGCGNWTFLCFTPGVILAVFLLFCRRGQRRALKIAFLLLTALLLFPLCGRALNGFSYATNRWCWAYSFLSCFILADLWPQLLTATRRERRAMVLFTAVLAILAMVLPSCRTSNVFMALLLLTATLLVLLYHSGAKSKAVRLRASGAIVGITLLSVTISAFFSYSPQEGNIVGGYLDLGRAEQTMVQTEDVAVQQAADAAGDTDFSRYTICTALMGQTDLSSSLFSGLYSTQYYWSLSNGNISQFLLEQNNLEYSTYRYAGLDDRTALLELASVGYYAIPVTYQQEAVAEQYLPYGYELAGQYCVNESDVQKRIAATAKAQGVSQLSRKEEDGIRKRYGEYYNIYRNKYALPLGYTYSAWMSREEYESLSATEKQEALLTCAVLDQGTETVPRQSPVLEQQPQSYQLDCGSGVTWEDGRFQVTSENATVTLTFDGLADSETYVSLEGLTYTGISPLDRYTEEGWNQLSQYDRLQKRYQARYWEESDTFQLSFQCGEVSKTLTSYTDQYTWYNNREDFCVNLGCRQEAANQVTITFAEAGTYTCDGLRVICQPMGSYRKQVSALTEDTLEDVAIGVNQVTGTITLDESRLLCLSIPYSAGWTTYVDGQEVQPLRANTMYLALPLTAGTHTIELRYTTQGLRAGAIGSAAGILAFCCVLLCSRRTKGRNRDEETHTLDRQRH